MRSDIEIRREVETRLRRRGLLVLNGILWGASGLMSYFYVEMNGLATALSSYLFFFMLAWTFILGLHVLRVVYVELRERMVRSAIERERQFYLLRDHHEKQKRSEARERENAASLRLLDDGELVDYPDEHKMKADYER